MNQTLQTALTLPLDTIAAGSLALVAVIRTSLIKRKLRDHHNLHQMTQHLCEIMQGTQDRFMQQHSVLSMRLDNVEKQAQGQAQAKATSVSRAASVRPRENNTPNTSKHQPENYRQAIKMIELGVEQDELADVCGISRAEAELLMSLYGHQSAKV